MNSIIVSCFPLCGRTYCHENRDELDLSCIDIDSCASVDNVSTYCDCIESAFGRYKYILVSYEPTIRLELQKRRLSFVSVVPAIDKDTKEKWFKRTTSAKDFYGQLRSLEAIYDEWTTTDFVKIGCPIYTLYTSEYLSDILETIE